MLTRNTKNFLVIVFGSFLIHSSGAAHAAAPAGPTKMSPEAKPVEHDPKVFGADPSYDDKPYSSKNQIDIYGAKKPVEVVNPLLELFRPVYKEGPFKYGDTAL